MLDRGMVLSDWEQYDKAVRYFTKMLSKFPANPRAYHERAMALINLDRNHEAIQNFTRALELKPNYPGALEWRANARSKLGDHQGAAEDLLAALRADPWGVVSAMGVSPGDWAECAKTLVLAGRAHEARDLLEEYFDKYSHRVTYYKWHETRPMRLYAEMLMKAGEFERACQFAMRARESPHGCPADLAVYAETLEAIGDYGKAAEICREALHQNDQIESMLKLQARLNSRAN